ncbi:hypothetical protein AVEN_192028-1 [Araneus ventricosus]|uniref:Uncharacterized protein n=1 Tax=Araneus ventricosus TaxID=182803 RepID=A0A4Y2B7S9_ARAVE|nr:hypothetical protein AVEN_192028-1 [Araneus ventricosus]
MKKNRMRNYRNKSTFLMNNDYWLNSKVVIETCLPTASSTGGRPKSLFESSAKRTKLRKVSPLVESRELSEYAYATQVKFRKSGKRDVADVMVIITSIPKRSSKEKRAYQNMREKNISNYSSDEALALMISAKLFKKQYMLMRAGALTKGASIYPTYHDIIAAEKRCYPTDSDRITTESFSEIKLRVIVGLTIKRLCLVKNKVIIQLVESDNYNLENAVIVFKWGCDGSGGQSRYKQKSLNLISKMLMS